MILTSQGVEMDSVNPLYLSTFLDLGVDWSEQPEEFAIISGYATTGEKWPTERNQQADEQLHHRLVENGTWLRRVTGYAPDTGHNEPCWAIAISFDEACDIGEEFLQDAIYYVVGDDLFVSHCDSRRVKTPISKFSLEIRPIRCTSTLESKLNPDVVSG